MKNTLTTLVACASVISICIGGGFWFGKYVAETKCAEDSIDKKQELGVVREKLADAEKLIVF